MDQTLIPVYVPTQVQIVPALATTATSKKRKRNEQQQQNVYQFDVQATCSAIVLNTHTTQIHAAPPQPSKRKTKQPSKPKEPKKTGKVFHLNRTADDLYKLLTRVTTAKYMKTYLLFNEANAKRHACTMASVFQTSAICKHIMSFLEMHPNQIWEFALSPSFYMRRAFGMHPLARFLTGGDILPLLGYVHDPKRDQAKTMTQAEKEQEMKHVVECQVKWLQHVNKCKLPPPKNTKTFDTTRAYAKSSRLIPKTIRWIIMENVLSQVSPDDQPIRGALIDKIYLKEYKRFCPYVSALGLFPLEPEGDATRYTEMFSKWEELIFVPMTSYTFRLPRDKAQNVLRRLKTLCYDFMDYCRPNRTCEERKEREERQYRQELLDLVVDINLSSQTEPYEAKATLPTANNTHNSSSNNSSSSSSSSSRNGSRGGDDTDNYMLNMANDTENDAAIARILREMNPLDGETETTMEIVDINDLRPVNPTNASNEAFTHLTTNRNHTAALQRPIQQSETVSLYEQFNQNTSRGRNLNANSSAGLNSSLSLGLSLSSSSSSSLNTGPSLHPSSNPGTTSSSNTNPIPAHAKNTKGKIGWIGNAATAATTSNANGKHKPVQSENEEQEETQEDESTLDTENKTMHCSEDDNVDEEQQTDADKPHENEEQDDDDNTANATTHNRYQSNSANRTQPHVQRTKRTPPVDQFLALEQVCARYGRIKEAGMLQTTHTFLGGSAQIATMLNQNLSTALDSIEQEFKRQRSALSGKRPRGKIALGSKTTHQTM